MGWPVVAAVAGRRAIRRPDAVLHGLLGNVKHPGQHESQQELVRLDQILLVTTTPQSSTILHPCGDRVATVHHASLALEGVLTRSRSSSPTLVGRFTACSMSTPVMRTRKLSTLPPTLEPRCAVPGKPKFLPGMLQARALWTRN